MKSIQNTSLNCGLLNAPVKIFAATGKEPEVRFNFCTPDGDPVEQIYVRAEDADEQDWTAAGLGTKRIVEVFDYDDLGRSYQGQQINRTELANAEEDCMVGEDGTSLKQINVERFVPLKDVPMERATKLYYLGPDPKVSTKSFKTFKEALKKKKAAAIAKVVIRSRQMILAIYVKDEIVHASVLSFAESMNNRVDEELTSKADVTKAEVAMMGNLIDQMMGDSSDIDKIKDTYIAAKRELVEKLVAGKPVKKNVKSKKVEKSDDSLMASLEASIQAAGKRKVRG